MNYSLSSVQKMLTQYISLCEQSHWCRSSNRISGWRLQLVMYKNIPWKMCLNWISNQINKIKLNKCDRKSNGEWRGKSLALNPLCLAMRRKLWCLGELNILDKLLMCCLEKNHTVAPERSNFFLEILKLYMINLEPHMRSLKFYIFPHLYHL